MVPHVEDWTSFVSRYEKRDINGKTLFLKRCAFSIVLKFLCLALTGQAGEQFKYFGERASQTHLQLIFNRNNILNAQKYYFSC